MPAEPPKPDPIVIAAYLDDVAGELEAARRLSEDPPREVVGPGVLSAYATTFRYPSFTGKRKPGLSGKEVLEWIERIDALIVDLRAVLAGSI